MKKFIKAFFLIGMVMLLVAKPQISNAQPPEDPGCPPECTGAGSPPDCPPVCLPIDGGLVLLIAAGIGLGAFKFIAEKKTARALAQ